jgi:SAM-dependent methyltransferase
MKDGEVLQKQSRWATEAYPDYGSEVVQSIGFSGLEQDFFTKGKADALLRLLPRLGHPLRETRALDIGCGIGLIHRHVAASGLQLTGIDISEEAIAQAAASNPTVTYRHHSGTELPFPDESFDVAWTICVMHHVPPPGRPRFVAEARRVLRKGGVLLVFEHNPWNPLTRLAVSRCAFDHDAVLISAPRLRKLLAEGGLRSLEQQYIFFTPFSAPVIQRIESHLTALPLGAQYVLAAQRIE